MSPTLIESLDWPSRDSARASRLGRAESVEMRAGEEGRTVTLEEGPASSTEEGMLTERGARDLGSRKEAGTDERPPTPRDFHLRRLRSAMTPMSPPPSSCDSCLRYSERRTLDKREK